jgi:hypothetical protein
MTHHAFLSQSSRAAASRDSLDSHLPKSESEWLYDWRLTACQFILATSPLRLTTHKFICQLNTFSYSPCVTSSLARGWVCPLQLLLVLPSAVIIRFESRETRDHISLLQIRDSPNLEGQIPVFIPPSDRVTQLYPQALVSLFIDPASTRQPDILVI